MQISEDIVKQGHSLNQAFRLVLRDIARKTGEFGADYSTFKSMPALDAAEIDADAVAIDRETARTEAEQAYSTLNDEQREAANAILKSLKIPIPAVDSFTGKKKIIYEKNRNLNFLNFGQCSCFFTHKSISWDFDAWRCTDSIC